MYQLDFQDRQQRINKFNRSQSAVKRDRAYVPMVIDESTDTTGHEWQIHCMALHIVNKPSLFEREEALRNLQAKQVALYEEVFALVSSIEFEYFGK